MSKQGIYVGPTNNSPNRDRQPTEKQRKWRARNNILWRLKGMSIPYYSGTGILTPVEVEKLTQAFSLIREVVSNSTQSSRELGFNAVERCRYCGKPSTHEGGLCDNCYNVRHY